MSLLEGIQNKYIYVSALDWGMGHLSRTCSIIQKLSKRNKILIFSTKQQFDFYINVFPDIPQVQMPSYGINLYPQSLFKSFFTQFLRFFYSIKNEHRFLKKYIKKHTLPDIIISDHRYGFYHRDVRNIFIGHQLEMQLPKVFSVANYVHHQLLNNFQEIWVPDYEDESISIAGKLSHTNNSNLKSKIKYILPQSLMQKWEVKKEIDYLFIISGTKAERAYYEKIFLKHANKLLRKNRDLKIKIIGGLRRDNKLLLGWKNFEETNHLILQSENIITRPGYSTLMDLHKIMDKKQRLFLINPKYQYEQRYLYKHWIDKNMAFPVEFHTFA